MQPLDAAATTRMAESLTEALNPVASLLIEAFVFGAVVAGTDTSQSNVDLALVGEVHLLKVSQLVDKAEHKLGRPVHVSLYGLDAWAAGGSEFLRALKHAPRIDLINR